MGEKAQRTRDDLLAAAIAASWRVEQVRALLAKLNGDVDPADWSSAYESLRNVESALTTIEQCAKRWGARH